MRKLPVLGIQQNENGIILNWITKDNLSFNMPLELKTKSGVQKIYFENNRAEIDIQRNEILEIDPNNWLLFSMTE